MSEYKVEDLSEEENEFIRDQAKEYTKIIKQRDELLKALKLTRQYIQVIITKMEGM